MGMLDGKTILVTGGTSGIGTETLRVAVREGARVAFTGRRADRGAEVVSELEGMGAEALYIQGDAAKEADCQRMVAETVAKFGTLDGAFNNAGVEGMMAPTTEQTEENYRFTFDINVLGVLLSMKHEIPELLKSGGSIVNNASIAGLIGMPGGTVYFGTKHAVNGMTKCAALELAQQGGRVNAGCPGGVETEMYDRFVGGDEEAKAGFDAMHPMGRVGTPIEIAELVVWLLSDKASFITGQCIAADGGFVAS